MCANNHPPITCELLATPELGHRIINYMEDLGIDTQQLANIVKVVRQWRVRYIELAETIVPMGEQIDDKLNTYDADLAEIKRMTRQRLELMTEMELEFIDTWDQLTRTLSAEQWETLQEIYRHEFKMLPHPILGARAHAPLAAAANR